MYCSLLITATWIAPRVNRKSSHLLAKYCKHTSCKISPLTPKSRANKNMLKNYIWGYLSVESSYLQILQKLGSHISKSLLSITRRIEIEISESEKESKISQGTQLGFKLFYDSVISGEHIPLFLLTASEIGLRGEKSLAAKRHKLILYIERVSFLFLEFTSILLYFLSQKKSQSGL